MKERKKDRKKERQTERKTERKKEGRKERKKEKKERKKERKKDHYYMDQDKTKPRETISGSAATTRGAPPYSDHKSESAPRVSYEFLWDILNRTSCLKKYQALLI